MADIKISELTSVSSLNNGDLVEVSQVNELAPSGYTSLKASMADIGKKVNTDIEYTTDLADFTDKTTLGAIKETAKGKNIADEYDDTQTYDKGDVVIYKNTLYICTTNNTTGTWDASKWTATTVQSLIGSLSSLTTTNKDSLVEAVNEVNAQRVWTINLGEVGSAVTINTTNWTTFDTPKSISLPSGNYIFVIYLNAKWTGSSYTFKASLQIDGANNVSTNAYSQEQANSMCAFVGDLLVSSDGAHNLQLACSVSNSAKSVQIMAYTPVMCMIFKK